MHNHQLWLIRLATTNIHHLTTHSMRRVQNLSQNNWSRCSWRLWQWFWYSHVRTSSLQYLSNFLHRKNPHEPSAFPRSIILTATAAMAGGTQLFEGAHLTGGTMRFCRESSKCRNYALFVGQIIKYALQIILGFGSNGPPSNKNPDSNVPLQIFGI